ncbi:MAG TPA: hypothetical protein VJ779_00635 [Acetobacteraceae bacterium]|nr:hypothetical protein [Acetobacteraceae bacterium]
MRRFLAITSGLCMMAVAAHANSKPDQTHFTLTANPAFVACLSADGSTPPHALVFVKRGELNDTALIFVSGLKPDLDFDLFTVQRSSLDANGKPVPNFPGFGLAWYQTDLHADSDGTAKVLIKTILLDQIFGFVSGPNNTTVLPPTNTFHVGFWFNNPEDAAPCGFDVTKPTPFNGEHRAGPLAMISLPDPNTGLGPLCTSPTGAGPDAPSPEACNP